MERLRNRDAEDDEIRLDLTVSLLISAEQGWHDDKICPSLDKNRTGSVTGMQVPLSLPFQTFQSSHLNRG